MRHSSVYAQFARLAVVALFLFNRFPRLSFSHLSVALANSSSRAKRLHHGYQLRPLVGYLHPTSEFVDFVQGNVKAVEGSSFLLEP